MRGSIFQCTGGTETCCRMSSGIQNSGHAVVGRRTAFGAVLLSPVDVSLNCWMGEMRCISCISFRVLCNPAVSELCVVVTMGS